MTNHLQEMESLFVKLAGEMAESVSINRAVGQLYALLYVSPTPLSLDQMAEKLQISKGSASINIRTLETWGAVKSVCVQGSRKDFYESEPDFLKIVLERIQHGLFRRLTSSGESMNQLNHLLGSEKFNGNGVDKKLKHFYQGRFKQLEEAKDLLETVVKFLPKIRSLKEIKFLSSVLHS